MVLLMWRAYVRQLEKAGQLWWGGVQPGQALDIMLQASPGQSQVVMASSFKIGFKTFLSSLLAILVLFLIVHGQEKPAFWTLEREPWCSESFWAEMLRWDSTSGTPTMASHMSLQLEPVTQSFSSRTTFIDPLDPGN